jgi:hypothetical protein
MDEWDGRVRGVFGIVSGLDQSLYVHACGI